MIFRILAAQLRKGKSLSLFWKTHIKAILPSTVNLKRIQNVRFLPQHCKETLFKKKLNKQALLVFLVGPVRYPETVQYLREVAFKLYKLLMRQCEVHFGLRIGNSIHVYCIYSRIWGEEIIAKMFTGLRNLLISRTKFFLFSAMPLSVITSQTNIISDVKLDEARQEYTTLQELCDATLYCQHCLKRKIIDNQFDGIDYCKCEGKLNYTDSSCVYQSWEPFIERENTIVWRKQHEQFKNLYCYKFYGKYADISANSFAEVQLNTSNRMEWDSSALKLTVEESDHANNVDILYWKVKFPTFFANRDYVYKRRFHVNENRKEMIIVSEAIQHDNHPKISGIHRVEDYWASIVIKADTDFHLPGMSYTITYFDNPGTTLPNAILNLIASKGFPEFLSNVHNTAYQLQKRSDNGEDIYLTLPKNLRYRKNILSDLDDNKPTTNVNSVESTDEKSGLTVDLNLPENFYCGDSNGIVLRHKLQELLSHTDNTKFPISFRNAVVDLLEATEVTGPDLNGETFLSRKIQEFMEKLLLEEQSNLVRRLLLVAEKTVDVMRECAAKKQDSLMVMRQLERRSHFWYYDENTQQFLTKFFITFNETLHTDKDFRTGKLLKKPEKSFDSCKSQKSNVHKSHSLESRIVCPCCAKPLHKSAVRKTSEIEECPNCYCNMNNSSLQYSILSRFQTNSENDTLNGDTVVEPDRFINNSYDWYFYPVFSTWKLILWLTSPWSDTDT